MTILYHYCSSFSFYEIVRNKTVWLSSLTLANDSLEGKVLNDVFKRITERYEFKYNEKSEFYSKIKFFEETIDGLGFCLSEVGDLLSQWRGYAGDGKGFSIGFSKAYLESLSDARIEDKPWFSLNKVLYDPEEQEAIIKPLLDELKKDIESGKLIIPIRPAILFGVENEDAYVKGSKRLLIKFFPIIGNMYTLKNLAFSEEREWRLVSPMLKRLPDDCLFRPIIDRLIPYREFEIRKLETDPIVEVIIGPKNITPIDYVEKYLNMNGFENVKVSKSSASYR